MRQHFQNHSLPDTKHKAWFPRLGPKIVKRILGHSIHQSHFATTKSIFRPNNLLLSQDIQINVSKRKIYILRVLIEVERTPILTQYLDGGSFQTLFFLPQANDVRWQHLIELSHFSHLENSFLYLIVTSVKFWFLKMIQLIRH